MPPGAAIVAVDGSAHSWQAVVSDSGCNVVVVWWESVAAVNKMGWNVSTAQQRGALHTNTEPVVVSAV